MHAERVFLETDEFGNLTGMPKLPPRSRVEAIFLVLAEDLEPTVHCPHPALAGKGHVKGDIISPAFDESDWNMLQ